MNFLIKKNFLQRLKKLFMNNKFRIGFSYHGKFRIGTVVMLFNDPKNKKEYMKVKLENDDECAEYKTFKVSKCSNLMFLESGEVFNG